MVQLYTQFNFVKFASNHYSHNTLLYPKYLLQEEVQEGYCMELFDRIDFSCPVFIKIVEFLLKTHTQNSKLTSPSPQSHSELARNDRSYHLDRYWKYNSQLSQFWYHQC